MTVERVYPKTFIKASTTLGALPETNIGDCKNSETPAVMIPAPIVKIIKRYKLLSFLITSANL